MSGKGGRFFGVLLTLGLVGMGLLFLFAVMESSRDFGNPMPFVALAGGAAVMYGLWRGPMGRAIARMLEGDPVGDDALAYRVDEVEMRLGDMRIELQRLGELEERVEFSERLLARHTEALPGRSGEERP